MACVTCNNSWVTEFALGVFDRSFLSFPEWAIRATLDALVDRRLDHVHHVLVLRPGAENTRCCCDQRDGHRNCRDLMGHHVVRHRYIRPDLPLPVRFVSTG